jgi:hypothetical protein
VRARRSSLTALPSAVSSVTVSGLSFFHDRVDAWSLFLDQPEVPMTLRRMAATLLVVLGFALVALGFLLPGGERLIRENLPLETHVTVLAPGDGGTILAANQAGEI